MAETESFGKLAVENSVMTGGHYCKGKEATSLISEVMTALMFGQLKCDMENTNSEMDNQIQITETKMQQASDVDHTEFSLIWEDSKSFTEWKAKSCNENVIFWSLFLDDLYPILRDLTHPMRQGNWHLFISALRRCMPLFFGFGRTYELQHMGYAVPRGLP